jgi:small subunit ribosomal protein S1
MAEQAQTVGNPDFDWNSIGKKQDNYSVEEKEKLDELYSAKLSTIADLQIIEGVVVAKNNREVVVNIGYKSDGVVALSEFRYNPDLKVGDKIEVFIDQAEDMQGQLVLSHKKARAGKSWDRVNEALNTDEIVKGFVKCRTKGGLLWMYSALRPSYQVHKLM